MGKILISLFIGVIIGYIFNLSEKQKKINSKLQLIGVIFLLFFMGISIGANKNIIDNLKNIGLTSASFAIFTSLFSIVSVYFVSSKFMKGEKR